MKDQTYLGDGVYASFDGWQIELRAGEGNQIFLEGPVFEALMNYAKGCFNVEIEWYRKIETASGVDVEGC